MSRRGRGSRQHCTTAACLDLWRRNAQSDPACAGTLFALAPLSRDSTAESSPRLVTHTAPQRPAGLCSAKCRVRFLTFQYERPRQRYPRPLRVRPKKIGRTEPYTMLSIGCCSTRLKRDGLLPRVPLRGKSYDRAGTRQRKTIGPAAFSHPENSAQEGCDAPSLKME
jgi:hypothetical protein